jgi:phage shock protein E
LVLLFALASAATVLAQSNTPIWVDVRTASEFQAEHIDGALNIEFGSIVQGLGQRKFALDTPIVLYCASGRRAGLAQQSLKDAGYTQVTNVGGLTQAQEVKAASK